MVHQINLQDQSQMTLVVNITHNPKLLPEVSFSGSAVQIKAAEQYQFIALCQNLLQTKVWNQLIVQKCYFVGKAHLMFQFDHYLVQGGEVWIMMIIV